MDHKNLTIFYIIKELNRRQIHWLELLLLYQFRIKYRSRKENGRTDILSHQSDIMEEKKDRLYSILKKIKIIY